MTDLRDFNNLDEEREVIITIDDQRSITVCPTVDEAVVTLAVEDPHSVAIVGMTQLELEELIEALISQRRENALET